MACTLVKAVIALTATLVVAVASNPGPDSHRREIKEAIAAHSQLAAVLRLGSLTAITSVHHSVGIASYTTVNHRLVSEGAFGLVCVADLSW